MDPQTDQAKAIPFIVLTSNGKFDLTKEAHAFLSTINSKRLGVVSIAGKYRTGKSYFINKVLLGGKNDKMQSGFAVGHSVNACTKGLLVWNRVLKASEFGGEANLDILIVDTEGFDATDESANHNTRIFLFAVLLSSLFIYNSRLTIDERAIESLELVIKLAQNLKFRESGDESNDDISRTFPAFLWVVRDFALDKKNERGENLTERQYLEKALEESKGITDQAVVKNRIRKAIKKFFPRRDCMTFSRPAEREEDLRNLDLLPDSELRPVFRGEVVKARETIYKTVRSKLFNGNEISGPVFYELAQALVQVINSGQVPNIENIGVYAFQETLRKGSLESVKLAEQLIREAVQKGKPLAECRADIESQVMKSFKENSIGDRKLFKESKSKLQATLNSMFTKQQNEQITTAQKSIKSQFESHFFVLRDAIKARQITDFDRLKFEIDEFQNRLIEQYKNQFELVSIVATQRIELDKTLCNELFERKKDEERQRATQMDEIRFNLENNKLEVARKEQETVELRAELDRLNAQNRALKSGLDQLESAKLQLESKMEEESKAAQKQQVVVDLKIKQMEVEWLGKVEEMRKESATAVRAKEQELLDLKKEIAVKGSTADSYKKELTRRDKDVENYESTINNLKSERKAQEDKLAAYESRAAKAETELRELRDEIAAKNREIADLRITKQSLTDKLSFLNSRCEDMKALYEKVLPTAGDKQSDSLNSPQLAELMQTNREILGLLRQNEIKNKLLKEKLQGLKQLRQIFQECENVQCRRCLKLLHVNFFLNHMRDCQGSNAVRPESTGHFQSWTTQQTREIISRPLGNVGATSLFVRIKDSKPVSNGKEHYIEYHVSVFNEDEKPWVVRKKHRDFTSLISEIKKELPNVVLPKSSSKIAGTSLIADLNNLKRPQVEDRKRVLEECLNDLCKVSEIRQSGPFRRFLEIELKPSNSVTPISSAQQKEKQATPRDDSDSDCDSHDDFLDDSQDEQRFNDEYDQLDNENSQEATRNAPSKQAQLNSFKDLATLGNVVLNKVNKNVSLVGKGFEGQLS